MFWRDKEKMLLDTDLNNMAAYQNSQLKSTSDTTLKELSELHKILIPEVKEIQGLKPDLIGVTRQVQNHKGQHQGDQSVGSASAAGIPNYLPYRWLGSEPDNKHQQQRESYNRSSSESTQVLNHLAMAIVGGVSLIVPMLIMALHRSRATSLVTTSVAVTLFAVLLAIWPVISKHFPWAKKKVDFADLDETLGNKEVLLATAAYAAVLVVFVGASLSTAV
jgi:hypothetical protein